MSDFETNTYVELLPGCEEVYDKAMAGSRGWIRMRETDDFGFNKVFIEWDKDHWRYNGEADMWTFSSHFKVAEHYPDLTHPQVDAPVSGPCPDCGEFHEGHDDMIDKYLDDIDAAFDQAAESDAFVFISLRREIDPITGFEVFVINTTRGSVDADLSDIPTSDLLRLVQEQKRLRGE